jgi:hypothetical protein
MEKPFLRTIHEVLLKISCSKNRPKGSHVNDLKIDEMTQTTGTDAVVSHSTTTTKRKQVIASCFSNTIPSKE